MFSMLNNFSWYSASFFDLTIMGVYNKSLKVALLNNMKSPILLILFKQNYY
jgi:hypothetical protein